MSQWIGREFLTFWGNVKITRFILLVNWVWVGFDLLHLYLYIYVSLEFLLPTLNIFTTQYNTIQSVRSYKPKTDFFWNDYFLDLTAILTVIILIYGLVCTRREKERKPLLVDGKL